MEAKEFVAKLIEKGFLPSPELSTIVKETDTEQFLDFISQTYKENKPLFINKEIYNKFLGTTSTITETHIEIPVHEEKTVVIKSKDHHRDQTDSKVKIKKNYIPINKKIDINDWVTYYFDRYNRLRDILQTRDELNGTIAIGRAIKIDNRQKVALIGIVKNIRKTLSGSYFLELEDPTGIINVSLKSPNCAKKAEEIVFDEVLGIIGTKSGDIIYAEDVIFPEVPERPIKKSEDEVYALFISDIHIGSNMFLPKEFAHFIDWVNGYEGTENQKEIAKKVKYIFITGDLVDGIGVYPGQENELIIKDIYKQYEEFSKYIAQIPEDIQIIICPGNHDAVRIEEPQPALFKDIASPLYMLKNVHMVSNPALINIHNIGEFPGIDVLMYHGYSFDYYVQEVPMLRKYGYENMELVHQFLLRKRHLAPSHGSTLINPMAQDFLLIDKLPDVIVTGHVHKAKIGKYKNILTISSSCFQDRTLFQEKVGHHPEPGRVPILNLKTNELKMLRFK